MIVITNEERIYPGHLSTRGQVAPGRCWLLSAVLHLGMLAAIFLLSIHPGQVLAPVSLTLQSGLVHASLVVTLPGKKAVESSPSQMDKPLLNKAPEVPRPLVETVPAKPVATKHKPAVKKALPPEQIKREQRAVIMTRSDSKEKELVSSPKKAMPPRFSDGSTPLSHEPTGMVKKQVDKLDSQLASGLPNLVAARYDGEPTPASYPIVARRLGQEGLVVVEVWLDKDGKQEKRQIKRSSGFALLDKAALDTVAKNRFLPYSEGGIPKPSRLLVPIAFKLQGR